MSDTCVTPGGQCGMLSHQYFSAKLVVWKSVAEAVLHPGLSQNQTVVLTAMPPGWLWLHVLLLHAGYCPWASGTPRQQPWQMGHQLIHTHTHTQNCYTHTATLHQHKCQAVVFVIKAALSSGDKRGAAAEEDFISSRRISPRTQSIHPAIFPHFNNVSRELTIISKAFPLSSSWKIPRLFPGQTGRGVLNACSGQHQISWLRLWAATNNYVHSRLICHVILFHSTSAFIFGLKHHKKLQKCLSQTPKMMMSDCLLRLTNRP